MEENMSRVKKPCGPSVREFLKGKIIVIEHYDNTKVDAIHGKRLRFAKAEVTEFHYPGSHWLRILCRVDDMIEGNPNGYTHFTLEISDRNRIHFNTRVRRLLKMASVQVFLHHYPLQHHDWHGGLWGGPWMMRLENATTARMEE
jgi:hypothetical protein